MTNQKELTVRQIKTMFKDIAIFTGQPLEHSTNEILLLLETPLIKEQINKVYNAFKTRKMLVVKLKRFETITVK
jgi:hypothetical protein